MNKECLDQSRFQNWRTEIFNIDRELSALKKRLNLSKHQTTQIKHILRKFQDQTLRVRGKGQNFRNGRQSMEELEAKKQEEIKKILNKDQKKTYEQMKKDLRKQYRRPGEFID